MGGDEDVELGPVGGDDEGLDVGFSGAGGDRVSTNGENSDNGGNYGFEDGDENAYCKYGGLGEAGDSDGDSSSESSKDSLQAAGKATAAPRNQQPRAEEPGGSNSEEGPNHVGLQGWAAQLLLLQLGLSRIEEGLARMGERLAGVESNIAILLRKQDTRIFAA